MKHIYHILTILFIIKQIQWIINPRYYLNKFDDINRMKEMNKNDIIGIITHFFPLLLSAIISLIWVVIGFFTFNWFVFLLFTIYNYAFIHPLSKKLKGTENMIYLYRFSSIIGLSVSIFILLNSYYLKIDVYELFLNLFTSF